MPQFVYLDEDSKLVAKGAAMWASQQVADEPPQLALLDMCGRSVGVERPGGRMFW